MKFSKIIPGSLVVFEINLNFIGLINLVKVKLVSSQGELGNLMFYVMNDVLMIIIVCCVILILIVILFIIVFINYVVLEISQQYQCITWLVTQLYQKCENRKIIGIIFMIQIHAFVIVFIEL